MPQVSYRIVCAECGDSFTSIFRQKPCKSSLPKFCTVCRTKRSGYKLKERSFLRKKGTPQ